MVMRRLLLIALLLLSLATCAAADTLLRPPAVIVRQPIQPTFAISSASAIRSTLSLLKPVSLGGATPSSGTAASTAPDSYSTGSGVLLTVGHSQDSVTGSSLWIHNAHWGGPFANKILAGDTSFGVMCTATFGVTGASDWATNILMTGTFAGLPPGVHLYVLSLGVGFQTSDLELTLSGPPLAAPQTLSAELYPYNPFVETRVSFYVNVPATAGQNTLSFRLSVKPTSDGTGRGGFVHHAQLTRQD